MKSHLIKFLAAAGAVLAVLFSWPAAASATPLPNCGSTATDAYFIYFNNCMNYWQEVTVYGPGAVYNDCAAPRSLYILDRGSATKIVGDFRLCY